MAIPGVVAFGLTLLYKWGIIERLQIKAPNKFINDLANCQFCLSFWGNLILCIILGVIFREWIFLFIPAVTTVKTRNML